MNTLVTFYSLTGNCRMIAAGIADAAGADILELVPEQDIASTGFMKYFRGGHAVIRKQKPALVPYEKNPADYDLLFIGTPVWAWSYAPALRTLFSRHVFIRKKIALFCCHQGGKGRTFENIRKALPGNIFLGEIDFYEPLKNDTEENLEHARQWAQTVRKAAEEMP